MPSRSHSLTPETRKGNVRGCADHRHSTRECASPRFGLRRRTAVSGTKTGACSRSCAKSCASPSSGARHRVASTPPAASSIKSSVKKDAGTTCTAPGTAPTSSSATSNPPFKSGGSGGTSSAGPLGNATGGPGKPSFSVPVVLTKAALRSRGPTKPSAYKGFGPCSETVEDSTSPQPDPYLETQKRVLEIKQHAEFMARSKLGLESLVMNIRASKAGAQPIVGSAGPASHDDDEQQLAAGAAECPEHQGAGSIDTQFRGKPAGGGRCEESPTGADGALGRGGAGERSNAARTHRRAGRVRESYAEAVREESQASSTTVVSSQAAGSSKTNQGRINGGDGGSPSTAKSTRDPKSTTGSTSPTKLTQELQDDEDDEDDETGMPQAVRARQAPTDEPETTQEITKRIHRSNMEDIARSVDPNQLIRHLTQAGYFRYDYSGHTRTSTDNHNLKYGFKKGIERLYLWLSLYSPADDSQMSRTTAKD